MLPHRMPVLVQVWVESVDVFLLEQKRGVRGHGQGTSGLPSGALGTVPGLRSLLSILGIISRLSKPPGTLRGKWAMGMRTKCIRCEA